uniref:NACHT domain-containing protein n=1 Tax=Rhodanobacter glycinis TaxID=582702 RepID=UPI001C0F3142|nr:NACHT domain-containing protein [Rhodanobacter glycinis]
MADDESKTCLEPIVAIDKVRASKAGHAFHEAWAARSALELLLPSTSLVAITLEGFDEADESELGTGAVEVADLVRYHGGSDVGRAARVEIVQFKYSIASATVSVRAADLAKTLRKFADADAQLRIRHGGELVGRVVRYDFATNRPINANLIAAIAASIDDASVTGDIAKQKEQISETLKDYPHPHADLLRRLSLSGGSGSLEQADRAVGQILASWSETSDPESEKRLLKLRNLVRIKAGPAGSGDNRIDRVAVLAELGVDHEDRLYPTPDAFPPVEYLIERPIADQVTALARADGAPLIVHGAGGMGKTVLMQSIAERMRPLGQVVIFDGFGAGRWRDLADGRHRPERTLVHIANLLAGRGLCDILLPISDITSLLRGFRQRLAQAVVTVRQGDQTANVVLLLDAIDHAAISADENGTQSFAHVLLRSLSVDPIEGAIIVASCRTERLQQAVGESEHRSFEIPPFTSDEARRLILARDASANGAEIAALEMRSWRNPRCLDTLLADGRPYDPVSVPDTQEAADADVLDGLLRRRLENARRAARSKGTSDTDIDLLLTGLALLPPPVPLDELAAAHGIALAQVESFAADLAPLLERTAYGLMFRDEPTETLIRGVSGSDLPNRERVVATLVERQSESNYAARALPALLTSLRRTDQLVALAFDDRVPPDASKVSQRDIRLARITAALEVCAKSGRRDDLLRLLLEASLVAAGHERSDRFLYEFPDLAAVAGDAEALRRLFSTKAGWPGGRHSALALAYSFVGDTGEARRNARRAIDWHNWSASNKTRSKFKPDKASARWDEVGFAYVEMLVGNDIRVSEFFARRSDGDAYAKFHDLFDLFERHKASHNPPSYDLVRRLLRCRSKSRALWAAALHFSKLEPDNDRNFIRRLAASDAVSEKSNTLPTANLAAAARAIDLGLITEARAIVASAAILPASIYNYTSYWAEDRDANIAVVAAGIQAALSGKPISVLDLAPLNCSHW